MTDEIKLSEEEWKKRLPPEQYHVLREKGTEPPFSGRYYTWKELGLFCCAACGNPLFSSEAKYDSGSGWPSFWQPFKENSIKYRVDKSHFTTRVEVICARCESHLGHVFDDGPPPTGNRYCINSLSLKFDSKTTEDEPDASS